MLSICQHPMKVTRYMRLRTCRKFWSQGICTSPFPVNACFCELCSQCRLRFYAFLFAIGFPMSNKVTASSKTFPAVEVLCLLPFVDFLVFKSSWVFTVSFAPVEVLIVLGFGFFSGLFCFSCRVSRFRDPYRNIFTLKPLLLSWFSLENLKWLKEKGKLTD